MQIQKLGWVAFAVLAGGIVGAGFRAPGDKFGTVDMEKVFNESSFAKTQTENLKTMGAARQAVLEFLDTHRTMKADAAQQFRDLSLKDNASTAEKATLEKIKSDAQADETKYRDLSTKSSPTPDDLRQIADFNSRKDATEQLINQWQQDFMQEVQNKQASLRSEALDKVKQAVQKVGRDQGYSIVFDQSVAPYSANDITADAQKALK